MSVDTSWDIESYRAAYESEEHWTLKREFLEAHKHRIPETRLICLAQVYVNIELLGCRYPDRVMEQVSVLARDVGKAYKEKKKTRLQRTFVKASDAAGARLKGTTTSSLIEAASTSGNASSMSPRPDAMPMNQGYGNFPSSTHAAAGNFTSMGGGNSMSSMNMGAGNNMSSMNAGAGNFGNMGTGNFTNMGAGNFTNTGAGNSMSSMNTGPGNFMNTGSGNSMSSMNMGAGNFRNAGPGNSMSSMNTGPGNYMNRGSGNSMSSMNAGSFMSSNMGAGNSTPSRNMGAGNYTSSMNSGSNNMNMGAGNQRPPMNAGGSNPMSRGPNPMSFNQAGGSGATNQGGGNGPSLLGRPQSAVAAKIAALKNPVAFIASGTSNPLAENSGSDVNMTQNTNTTMLSGQNNNYGNDSNKKSTSLLGSPPRYNNNNNNNNSGFGGQNYNSASMFGSSDTNTSTFGGLSANPNVFGGSNQTSSNAGRSDTNAQSYGGSSNKPSIPGGMKASLYGGLLNSTQSGNTGGSGANTSMLGGSNTSSYNRPMLGGGSGANASMLGGSNTSSNNRPMLGGSSTMLGGSNSMMGGSNSGTSLLGDFPSASKGSCLMPGFPASSSGTTIITAPPNKKKKSKSEKNKDKPITEKFISFIGGGGSVGATSEATDKTQTQKSNANEGKGQGNQSYVTSSTSGFVGASSSNFSKMPGQTGSSFKTSGPSASASKQPSQPQSQAFARPTTVAQKQSHMAHWCNVVGQNNPLLAFVLVKRENHDNNGAAAAILNTSSCFSRIPINYAYNKIDNIRFECTLNINGVDVVSARSTSRKKARDQAVVEAVAELPKHCFTLRVKKSMQAESVTLDQVANDLAASSQDSMGSNSVANKMMKQMGWTGGGLGKKGEGITEPIRPSEVFGRQGLGMTETSSNVKGAVSAVFRKRVRDIINDYAANGRNINLAFSNEFSKEQRTEIHKIARLCHLKSTSHGSGKTRCVVISRKVAAQDLLLRLLQEGSNDQYQLTPPTAYQP